MHANAQGGFASARVKFSLDQRGNAGLASITTVKELTKISPLACLCLWFACLFFATLGATSDPVFSGASWASYWAAFKYHVVDNAIVTGPFAMSFGFLALGIHNCLRPLRRR
ncbi:MAG TPA: hypothetical protein VLE43_10565 [Candidatus Saccharimonadia bacterium]|nr:hypothetical protein [Candidatus Saccharimonadia bacterium]